MQTVREIERRGLIVVFIMMIVVSDGDGAICFSELGDWGMRSYGDWFFKNVGDWEGGAGIWRRESRIFNSSFSVESLHV